MMCYAFKTIGEVDHLRQEKFKGYPWYAVYCIHMGDAEVLRLAYMVMRMTGITLNLVRIIDTDMCAFEEI